MLTKNLYGYTDILLCDALFIPALQVESVFFLFSCVHFFSKCFLLLNFLFYLLFLLFKKQSLIRTHTKKNPNPNTENALLTTGTLT